MIAAKLAKPTRNSLMSDVCRVGYMLSHRWSSMSSIINTVLFLLFLNSHGTMYHMLSNHWPAVQHWGSKWKYKSHC